MADHVSNHQSDSVQEEWRAVPGFEGAYEVSDLGRVRSLDREIECPSAWGGTVRKRLKGRILKQATTSGGHLFVALGRGNQVSVHHLVLVTFDRLRRDGEECRHLDGNKQNNRLANLRWGTRLENMADRGRLGEHNAPRGSRNRRAVLTDDGVRRIRQLRAEGLSFGKIAQQIGVSRNAVGKVISGHTWGWLE